MAFCVKCGTQVQDGVQFCPSCGQAINTAPPPQAAYQQPPQQPPQQQTYQQPPQPQAYQQPQQQPQPQAYGQPAGQPYQPASQPGMVSYAIPKPPHYAPGSFAETLHDFGGSVLFLIGICLFSGGALFEIFLSFNWRSIFSLMIIAVPITGFWLIFAASKAPSLPEKTLTSLTLFKVSVIIDLVVRCLAALVLLIAAILLFYVASQLSNSYFASSGAGVFTGLGFVFLLIAGGVIAYIIIYFKAVLGLIAGIRNNLTYNTFAPLPDIKIFTILTYIGAGFAILSTIITIAAAGSINSLLYEIPYEYRDMFRSATNMMDNNAIAAFFTMVKYAGVVVCVVTLNQLSSRLGFAAPQVPGQMPPQAPVQTPPQAPPPPPQGF